MRSRPTLASLTAHVVARPFVTLFWAIPVLAGLLAGAVVTAAARLGLALLSARPLRGRLPRAIRRIAGSRAGVAGACVIAPFIMAWRVGARRERAAASRAGGSPVGEDYRPLRSRGYRSHAMVLATDPASWFDAAYLLMAPLLGLVGLAVVFVMIGGVALIVAAVIEPSLVPQNLPPWWVRVTLENVPAAGTLGVIFVGLVLGIGTAVATGAGQIGLARMLLDPHRETRLQAEVEEQRSLRQIAVEAAEAERRRIERDLHDGAQQRLTSLALTLGMARHRLATDPEGAAELLAQAHTDAKEALTELRSLARGIHPTLLTERGLEPSLMALARRAGVPVEVEVTLADRPPAPIESAAYFLVAEALTNVTRHAKAGGAWVTVAQHNGALTVEVRDDGCGGADAARGTGLAGLADRVAALDGRFELHSPDGGPTVISAELPCAS